MKMNKWKIAVAAIAAVLFVAWYAFRPERLFINQPVHEAMPAANVSSNTGNRVRRFLWDRPSYWGNSNHLPDGRRRSHAPLHGFQNFQRTQRSRLPGGRR